MPHTAYIIHQFTQFDVYKPSNHTIVGLLTWFEFSVTITFHCEMKLWLSCVITERRETFFFFLSGWSQCNFIHLFTVWNIVNEWKRNKQCAFWWNDEALLIESTYFLYVSAENRNWRFSSNNSEKKWFDLSFSNSFTKSMLSGDSSRDSRWNDIIHQMYCHL